MIDTIDNNNWALAANWGRVGGPSNVLFHKNDYMPRKIIIEPQLPYIYVSQADYANWVTAVKGAFALTEYRPDCNAEAWGNCVFNAACSKIPNRNVNLIVNLFFGIGPDRKEWYFEIP